MSGSKKWKKDNKIYIPTINKIHGRERTVGFLFDFEQLGLKRGGLAECVIDSYEIPAVHRKIQVFQRILSWLILADEPNDITKKICAIFSTPMRSLRPVDIDWLFTRLEDYLATKDGISEKTQYSYSSEFRSWICHVPGVLQDGNEIRRAIKFSSRFRTGRSSREIISEMVDPGSVERELSLPVSTLRYGSLQDLDSA